MNRMRRGALVAALHTIVAVVTTWPLATHFTTHIALGRERTPTVPFFNLWSLEWNLQRIQHLYAGYWDAPIFSPTAGTFARSEAQPVTGMLFAMFRMFVGSAAGYNLVLLTFLMLNGAAGTLLARRFRAAWPAAIATGIAAQAIPFVWNQLGVLQLVCVFPMLFAFERLLTYRTTRKLTTLFGASAWCVVCAGTSGYYAIFLLLMIAIVAPVLLIGAVPAPRLMLHASAAVALVLLCTAPYLLAQRHQLETSDTWQVKTITNLSAHPSDYIDQLDDAVTLPILRDDGNSNGIRESPGVYLMLLGVIGTAAGWKLHQRRAVIAALAAGAAMFVASVGMHLSIFGWHAYRWMYDEVPGFDRLRSPFRFSVGVQIAIIVLVALAATAVVKWRRPAGVIFTLGFALLVVLESVPFGSQLERVPATKHLDWVQYLERAPAGVVAMVPFPDSGKASAFRTTTVAMLAALQHGHPIVNGYTGFFPAQFDRAANEGGLWYAMDDFPDLCGAEQLQRRNVQYLVVERGWYSQERALRMLELGYRMVFNGRNDVVLRDSMKYRYQDECA